MVALLTVWLAVTGALASLVVEEDEQVMAAVNHSTLSLCLTVIIHHAATTLNLPSRDACAAGGVYGGGEPLDSLYLSLTVFIHHAVMRLLQVVCMAVAVVNAAVCLFPVFIVAYVNGLVEGIATTVTHAKPSDFQVAWSLVLVMCIGRTYRSIY